MRAYSFGFRITAWTVIAFFSWTFLSLWEIPAAFAAEKQKPSQMRNEGSRPEEKFEKALEALREHVDKAGKKADTGEDDSAESEAIKAKKNELALLDSELKKEFTETEKRLKSAALPKTILDRHEQFVRRYTDNYTLLRTEIDDIDKAKTRADRKAKIEKARLHLEKTKRPSIHQKLDPNNLPFRARKAAKAKEPRLKKEEFEKEFSPQKKKNNFTAENPRFKHSRAGAEGAEKHSGLILTASSPQRSQRITSDLTAENPRFKHSRAGAEGAEKHSGLMLTALSPQNAHKTASINHKDIRTLRSSSRLRDFVVKDVFSPERTRISGAGDFQSTIANLPQQSVSRGRQSAINQKPIMLAYNGPVSDMPLFFGAGLKTQNSELKTILPDIAISDSPLLPFTASEPLMLAQAADLPTADDLAEAPPAIQFTSAIRAKAQDELGCNPTKIYNWVRNNIYYEPYYGSFKSADQTLLEGAGNDFDQASLLISLMRVCNIAAKYAYGTVEIPSEKAANMVGVSDPTSAATILATQGIPVKLGISGGVVKAIRIERAWVEAWIDYFPSWGARHKQGGEDTWIPLDPAFKLYTYKQGMDMYAEMGFNAEDFLMSYITDTRDITAYQDYGKRLVDFIDANYPDATIEQVFGASDIKATRTIIKQEFPYLLGTLPYKTIVKAAEFSQVPSTKDYAITIQIEGNALDGTPDLNYSGYLNNLADKRVTVSYDPATSADQALVAQYGGNMLDVPPYLLNVKPILKISGTTVATGVPIGLGQDQNIIINFAGPDGDTDRIQNVITAGAYSAIILQSQTTPLTIPSNNMVKLVDNSKKVDMPDITLDDLLGQMLYTIGIAYFHNLSIEDEVYAKTLQLINLRQPAEAMVTYGIKVNYFFGIPRSLVEGNINIDVDRNINVVVSPTQDNERVKAFMILSGLSSSMWENRILEGFFDIPSVSAVRLLKLASEISIPIYTINNTNLNEILPQLQVGANIKTDIVNAVNAGKKVVISKTNINYNQWNGAGYIIIDPITGAAGYMISGGLAGSNASHVPQNSWFTRYAFVNAMISPLQRRVVVLYAITKLWTPYDFGTQHGGLDCSELTYKAYRFVGIKDFPDGAEAQYTYVSQRYGFTDKPLIGDIVFFHATYDSNGDGVVDVGDKSHVGISVNSDAYIAAQRSRGTNLYWYEQDFTTGNWAQNHLDSFGIVIP